LQWRLTWDRFRRDRLAVAALAFCILLFALIYVGEPIGEQLLSHGPDDPFPYAVNLYLKPDGLWSWEPNLHEFAANGANGPEYDIRRPKAPATTPNTLLILGGDGPLGRDELLRLLAGGKVTLEVAVGGTAIALLVGTLFGAMAAMAGGIVDAVVSRFTEFVMAFPLLLLLIMIGSTSIGGGLDNMTLGGLLNRGVLSLALVIGAFTWFYPARLVRTQILALRQREFVEAAEMIGATRWRIVRTHLMPHVAASLGVYATLAIATNVMLEAGVSFLGVGVKLPTASWGNMLGENWGSLLHPTLTLVEQQRALTPTIAPSVLIFLTIYAFNLVGEGLRKALEPGSTR
jgi:peptide/nickel transport system permease protein